MNFNNIKTKISEFIKNDDEALEERRKEDEQIDIQENRIERNLGMQMKLLRFVLGYAVVLAVMQVIVPDMLTLSFFKLSVDNGFTIMSMFPIILFCYVMFLACDMMGGMCIFYGLRLFNNLKEKLPIPTIISNMAVPIVLVLYITYRLITPYIPTILGAIR
jgi:hypothetical protein